MKLPKPAHDKCLHFLYGSLMTFVLALIIRIFELEEWDGFMIPIVLVAAIITEVYDVKVKKSYADPLDIIWTIIPAAMMFFVL